MNIRILEKMDERGASVRAKRRGRARRKGGGISRKLKGDYLFHFQFILQLKALPLYHAI